MAKGIVWKMIIQHVKPFAALLMTTIVVVGFSIFPDFAAAQTRDNSDQDAKSNAEDKQPADKKPAEAKIKMFSSAPVLRRPEPVDLPDFSYWEVKIQYKNEGDEEVVIYPYVDIEVFDAAGESVEMDAFMGIGFRTDDWLTEHEKAFLVIAPGQTKKIVVDLSSYVRLVDGIGWDFETPGTYKLVMTYQFDRKRFEKDIAPWLMEGEAEWAKNPERLWNRAEEMKRSVEVKLDIKK